MTQPQRLGILGGTLDPVHFGHLDAAEAARHALRLDEVWFVPSHDPPHRPLEPLASPFHRFAMASLVAAEHPAYRASDLELRRAGPSYTIDTLQELHGAGLAAVAAFLHHRRGCVCRRGVVACLSRRARGGELRGDRQGAGRPAAQVAAQAPELAAQDRDGRGHHQQTRPRPGSFRSRHGRVTCRRRSSGNGLRHNESIADLVPAPVERHIMAYGLYGSGRQIA